MSINIIWRQSPSQIINAWWFLATILVVPAPIAIWKYLETRFTQYQLTEGRLLSKKGVFNTKVDEIELYRIKDYRVIKPLFLRIFGLGSIILLTSDRSNPQMTLLGIEDPEEVKNFIRDRVEILRKLKGVREFD